MFQLIFVVFCLLGISFICSILEAVILTITPTYINMLIDKKNRAGPLLFQFKEKIEEPISAILTLNTISHTVGAAVSGAIALQVLGSEWIALFSAVLTFLVLIFSEIIPKTLGAHYWKTLGPFSAYILKSMVFVLRPIIVPMLYITKWITQKDPQIGISKEEVIQFIRISYSNGVIQPAELEIMENLFKMHRIKIRDVMTPRTVVFSLPPELTIEDLEKTDVQLNFSRIPLYNAHENTILGIVLQRDIMNMIAKKETFHKLESLGRAPEFVIETMSIYRLLNMLISSKTHLAIVLNEYGDFIGVVSMEDAIETLLGREIVDEFDPAVNMRALAIKKRFHFFKKKK